MSIETTADISPSYLLTTTRGLPEWAINLLADDYASTIRGSHGFRVRHPRAPKLTLVVSDNIECGTQGCDELARWEEDYEHQFCPRCAEAEIAVVVAAKLKWPRRRPPSGDLTQTTRLPRQSMADMVFGARAFAVLVLALGLAVGGCATAPRSVEVEAVGQLAQGSSVWHAPTHASTDLSGGFQAVEGDDSATKTITTVSAVEAPEVTAKTDGVTTGGAR